MNHLHPGIVSLLNDERFRSLLFAQLTELEVAQAMVDGKLPSPQLVGEATWLFDMRITGTGTAYRSKHDEVCYRPPEHYLNPTFLARCNGLTVMVEHPDKGMLNTEEFRTRAVGSIFIPYIKGEEVWGVARIYDEPTARLMMDLDLSTSPAVSFSRLGDSMEFDLENGDTLLIEGKPILVDGLAICSEGVWDVGGSPVGINATNNITSQQEANMEKEPKEEVKADEAGTPEQHIMKMLQSLADGHSKILERLEKIEGRSDDDMPTEEVFPVSADAACRPDASALGGHIEPDLRSDDDGDYADEAQARVDAKRAKNVKRADAGEDASGETEKERMDADKARLDAVISRFDQALKDLPKPMTDADYAAMAEHQSRADSAYNAFGDRAPAPLRGESLDAYRCRLLGALKKHSKEWATVDLARLDSAVLDIAENKIYADSAVAARDPSGMPVHMLREVRSSDESGRVIKSFVGSPKAWMNEFKGVTSLSQFTKKGA